MQFLIRVLFVWLLVTPYHMVVASEEITPYKFEGSYGQELAKTSYRIPSSSRFTVSRSNCFDAPEIVYYFTKPSTSETYPIAIVCGGSTTQDAIGTIIHFHRYFLEEFLSLGVAVITVEQWGIDGTRVDKDAFMAHYTRSQRLQDHQDVIEHLKLHPPHGWDGTLLFLGVSEGGPLVTTLTESYGAITRATINWVGAGDWPWSEELWTFILMLRKDGPWWLRVWDMMPTWMPFSFKVPKTKKKYDQHMKHIAANPCTNNYFMGMTYLYHADAMITYPPHDYSKIKTPFLVVVGSNDPMIESADAFARKAQEAGVPITYLRVDGMDHYIRCRSDIVEKSFEWLQEIVHNH